MELPSLRAITVRATAFLLALIISSVLCLARHIYVERQGLFADAALMGRPLRMKLLYALGVDVNAPGCEHRRCFNPMWGAAYGGYDDEIIFLLDRGADVNARPQEFRVTALMMAAYNGHESTVQLLISKGADVNVNIEGSTALSLARDKGRTKIVELLQQAGAKDIP